MKALRAVTGLIALLVLAQPVGATPLSIYEGILDGDDPYTIVVDAGVVSGRTGITISYLSGWHPETEKKEVRLGKGVKFDLLTVEAGARRTFVREIPKGTQRIVVELATLRGSGPSCEIQQGLSSFVETCENGCTMVFDVAE